MTLRDRTRNAAYRSLAMFARGRPSPLILLYHSIGAPNGFSLPPAAFAAQMALVAERFTVVPLSDLRHAHADGAAAASLACITFDDGYRDNHEHALPVLERHGLRATFLLATGFLGGRYRSWADDHPMLTPAQVREMSTLGHEIGAHTVTHAKLIALPPDAVRREVVDSKACLEELVGRPVRAFAYPKGAHDDGVRRIVAAAGFRTAVTVREGLLNENPDWLALPRLAVRDGLSLKAFEAKLSRAADWYRRLRGHA